MAEHRGITYSRQDQFDVEEDLRCEKIDLDETDSSWKIAYMLCNKAALLGEFILQEEAKAEIIREATRVFSRLCRSKDDLPPMDEKVLAAACVLLSQNDDDKGAVEENSDSGNTWKAIMSALNFADISQKTGCSFQTARNRLCKVLENDSNIRFFTQNGQRFYNTLKLHALSPVSSINNLFEILYTFYRRNLECSYDKDSQVASLFTAGIRRRWNEDDIVDEQKLRSNRLASGLRELFVLRPKFMAAVCDALLERIDRIVQGDTSMLDNGNRWDVLLLEWYKNKSEFEKKQVQGERRSAVKKRIVDKKENIHPEYVYEDGCIILRIPGIRLPEITERPILKLLQNGNIVYEQKLSIFGDDVLWSTRSVEIPLDKINNIRWDNTFLFEVTIQCGSNQIYSSGAELFRDYICFGHSGNETRSIQGNEMVRLGIGNQADLVIDDPSDSWLEDIAPYRLIRLWPDSIKSIVLDGNEILETSPVTRKKLWAYFSIEANSEITAVVSGKPAMIFTKQPLLCAAVGNKETAKNYQIIINGESTPLYKYLWKEGQYHVQLPKQTWTYTSVQIKDFERGIIVFHREYIIIPGLTIRFEKDYYLDKECTVLFKISVDKETFKYASKVRAGTDKVKWLMNGIQFEASVPKVRAELNDRNAFSFNPMTWHQELKYSYLTVYYPEGVSGTVMLDGKAILPNSVGKYEIGTAISGIASPKGGAALEIMVYCGCMSEDVLLTDIRFSEIFYSNPIIQRNREILWKPDEAGYIGPTSDVDFRLELENSSQEEPFTYALSLKNDFIERKFDSKEGKYHYTLWLTKRKKLFTKLPDLQILEGEITVFDPPEDRFKNKYIILNHSYYYDPIYKKMVSSRMQKNGAVLFDIQYEGEHEIEPNVFRQEYSGILYFKTSARWVPFSDRESEWTEKINPVFFYIEDDQHLIAYTSDDEQLMLNLKYLKQNPAIGGARIFSRKDELSAKEQESYLGYAEKFRFITRTE